LDASFFLTVKGMSLPKYPLVLLRWSLGSCDV
jgi:hypothetical protein